MKIIKASLNIILCLLIAINVQAKENKYIQTNKQQALIWEQLPYQWNEGAFLENGIVGMVVSVDSLDKDRAKLSGEPASRFKKTAEGGMDNSFIQIINQIPAQKAGDYGWVLYDYFQQQIYTL